MFIGDRLEVGSCGVFTSRWQTTVRGDSQRGSPRSSMVACPLRILLLGPFDAGRHHAIARRSLSEEECASLEGGMWRWWCSPRQGTAELDSFSFVLAALHNRSAFILL